jgi:hypothetical protein
LDAGRYEQSRHYLSQAAAELADVEPVAPHVSLALTHLQIAFRTGNSTEVDTAIAELERLGDPMGSPRARVAVLGGRCHAAFAAGRYVKSRTH